MIQAVLDFENSNFGIVSHFDIRVFSWLPLCCSVFSSLHFFGLYHDDKSDIEAFYRGEFRDQRLSGGRPQDQDWGVY
jgi:hypothetical protein